MIDLALESQIANLAESMGFVLYDIVWVKENEQNILRVSLTKPHNGGTNTPRDSITLDECALFSTALSPLLDVALEQSHAYHLEVSSPGLERTLKKPKHFALSLGEEVSVVLKEKSTFSIFGDEPITAFIAQSGCKNLVIFGIESHVCILQSVLHALTLNFNVWVVQDALSSRDDANHLNAISLMAAQGARVTNTESVLFGSMLDSKDPHFKAISALVK